jgi:hypothetical protein
MTADPSTVREGARDHRDHGGRRVLRDPDPVARDYLLLALRLDRLVPGTVDGYFGPAALKAQVDGEEPHPPARLAEKAAALRARLPAELPEPDRRHWLDLQLVALETLARVRAGEPLSYLDQVTRCFAYAPARRPVSRFDTAAAQLDLLLPGQGSLEARLQAEDDAWTVPPERVPAVVDLLVCRFRERAALLFGLPEGEDLRVSLVRDEPWSGYNWYDGGYRSRVELNLDLPIRLPGLIGTVAHETYPGHHLEHATKERVLVENLGRLEASALLINTPECLISEGLANLGHDIVVAPGELEAMLLELAPLADVPVAADPVALGEAAARHEAIAAQRAVLGETRINAALMLHADGAAREDVLEYLVEIGRMVPDEAAKRLQFIEHPLWRTYIFVYSEGEALLRRWLGAGPAAEPAARFGRLLREQLTPPAIEAEIAVGQG